MFLAIFRPSFIFPALALLFVALTPLLGLDADDLASPRALTLSGVMIVLMVGAVFAAVHHAEVIAHRVGEPLGTLVLTLAVTIIEVALIASLMTMPSSDPALARDTVFAVIMIVVNGLVGICIVLGGTRHYEQDFQVAGATSYLTVLGALTVLSLVLPNYTQTLAGPYYANSQLLFVIAVTIVLYAGFLFIQTVRHVDYFLDPAAAAAIDDDAHAPTTREFVTSIVLLLVALAAVILIAKKFAVVIEGGLAWLNAPKPLAGVAVALIVLAPESIAAIAAARSNVLQKSVNLALGSALATIGLTIPAVGVATIVLGTPVVLGLQPRDALLLAITLFVGSLTLGTGRTNILSGLVHLVLFATFLFFLFVP